MNTTVDISIVVTPGEAARTSREFAAWMQRATIDSVALTPGVYRVKWADHLGSDDPADFAVTSVVSFATNATAQEVFDALPRVLADDSLEVHPSTVSVTTELLHGASGVQTVVS